MQTYAVTPSSMKNGENAPTIFVDADEREVKKDKTIVPTLARAKSGLGGFQNWDFETNIIKLRRRTKKRKRWAA